MLFNFPAAPRGRTGFLDAFQLPRGPARPYGLCTVPYEYWMVTEIAQGKDYIRYETSKVPVPVLYECSPRIRGLRTRPGATAVLYVFRSSLGLGLRTMTRTSYDHRLG